jgi:hypothetical protein
VTLSRAGETGKYFRARLLVSKVAHPIFESGRSDKSEHALEYIEALARQVPTSKHADLHSL